MSMPPTAKTVPQIQPVPGTESELEPMYRVIIHNDDVTPMDFVVLILERIFFISGDAALEIMYTAHFSGAAYVQSLPRTEAQNRVGRAHFAAGLEGYPLRFTWNRNNGWRMELTGLIFNIQRFSIHDGPGIRTTVFLKGCWLRCFWCHNPEGLRGNVEIQFTAGRCIGCGECVQACAQGAQQIVSGERVYDRDLCIRCGKCLETCYTGALEQTGERVTTAQVMDEILADRAFYEQSGGGVTLSGGDPLLQLAFTLELLRTCKARGLHTTIETAAHCRWEVLEQVLPWVDLVMLDLKHLELAETPGRNGGIERAHPGQCRASGGVRG